MTTKPSVATETIECPLCLGEGELTRAEILDRLCLATALRNTRGGAERQSSLAFPFRYFRHVSSALVFKIE
jgi:hypothetical protein